MKNRLIVAAIGIPALLAVIFFTPIWGWGIVVAIMAAFCAWELLHTAMPKFVPRFAVYAGMCGAAIVLGAAFGKSELVFKIAAYVLFVTMFVEMMISFHKSERIPFQDLALVFTAGIVIPWMLSSLVRLGLNDPKAPYLLLPFVITWLSDSGAFFVGRRSVFTQRKRIVPDKGFYLIDIISEKTPLDGKELAGGGKYDAKMRH